MHAEYAIQASEAGKLTFKQIEACRRALRRGLGKTAKIFFHVFTVFLLVKNLLHLVWVR